MANKRSSPSTQAEVVNPEEQALSLCHFCDPENPAKWHCDSCSSALFCDSCWKLPTPHRKKDPIHVKVSLYQYQLVTRELDSHLSSESLAKLHARDSTAVWFAVDQDSSRGGLKFTDYPRFKVLVDEHTKAHGISVPCHPKLVSFVGITGSGKSTLIKFLMKRWWLQHEEAEVEPDQNEIEIPVAGEREISQPTSGDVHLYREPYVDPLEANRPLFYADCEGFGGGDVAPSGSKFRQDIEDMAASVDAATNGHYAQRTVEFFRKGVIRAIDLPVNDGGFIRRQWLVKKLFPRLLYNFSDVVVHVISGQAVKQMEHNLLQVIKWAKSSETAAVNHPFLPHLIIVVNAASERSAWDPEEAHTTIIQEQSGMLKENQTAKLYAEQYERLGKSISTVEDLLHCFYAKVEFIFIPQAQSGLNQRLFLTQIQRLHSMLESATRSSQILKEESRLLLPSEDQEHLFRLAFTHYTNYLDKPFDFLETLFAIRPLPHNLSNNLVRLLSTFQTSLQSQETANEYITALAPILATTIALDVARSYRIKVQLIDIFKGNLHRKTSSGGLRPFASPNSYEAQLQWALNEFCERSVPCSFRDKSGRRCVNTKRGHRYPFHQTKMALPLGFGTFDSKEVNELMDCWLPIVEEQIKALSAELESNSTRRDSSTSATSFQQTRLEEEAVWARHTQRMSQFFRQNPNLKLDCPLMCCFCLQNLPFEILPCGHSVCDACIPLLACSTPSPDSRVVCVQNCLLHNAPYQFDPLHAIHIRSKFPGRRILALDGGGVRAIMQLKILAAIEKKMGGFLPIQRFFDLIGGTSAGALVAFAIGIKDWRFDHTELVFREICERAFSNSIKTWIFRFLRGSQYRAEPLAETLKEVLGEVGSKYLVQARMESSGLPRPAPRVFATATINGGDGAAILPNYVRPHDRDAPPSNANSLSYQFEVYEQEEAQMRVWEAARSTTAAPTYFVPFSNQSRLGNRSYYDGGLYHNNPSKVALEESYRIWPEKPERHPDVLLSVGCGYSTTNEHWAVSFFDSNALIQAFKVVRRRFEQILNSERSWDEGIGVLSRMEPRRYFRLSPQVTTRLPDLDDKKALANGSLEKIVNEFLCKSTTIASIKQVARRLIATSFYLEPTTQPSAGGEKTTFHGTIRCRFIDKSSDIKAFADVIKKFCSSQYADFDLQQPLASGGSLTIGKLTPQLLEAMKTRGNFCIDVEFPLSSQSTQVDVSFSAPGFEAESIGGCPFLVSTN